MCYKNGQVFIDLIKFINSKFEVTIHLEILKKYLKELAIDKKIFIIGKKIYTAENYKAEKESALIISKIIHNKNRCTFFKSVDPEKFIKGYEDIQTSNIVDGKWKKLKWEGEGFALSQKQKEAIFKFIEKTFLIITGLPGTGKCFKKDTRILMFDG